MEPQIPKIAPPVALELTRRADSWIAGAIIVDPDRRYLMQLRDDKPALPLPGHWALFGGEVEAGESPREAILRELLEELEFAACRADWLTETVYAMPGGRARVVRKTYFVVPIARDQIGQLVQHEGADMGLFTLDDLFGLARIAPWDLAAIMMYQRLESIFA